MTTFEIPAPSRYSRRLAVSLAIAVGLHLALMLIPFYRWLGDRSGESSGLGDGPRPFTGALLGTAISVRSPLDTPQDAESHTQPTPAQDPSSTQADVTNEPLSSREEDLGLEDLPPVTLGGAAHRRDAEQAVGSVVGGSLRPLEGGGNAQIEMPVDVRISKIPDMPRDVILKRNIDDELVMQVLVDRDGLVIDSRVLRSIPRCPECTTSAVEAARAWQFEQPIYEGQHVQAWVTLRFRFGPNPG
jgi:TonB family protein